jgi:maltose-binding protein MalE
LLPSRWLGDYIAAQALEPLDDYAEDEFLEGFVDAPPLLAAHRYGGQLLALPAYVTVRPLLYNRRFMEQPPATWEELAKTGLAVASDPRVFALGLDTQGVEGANHFCSFLWSAGGDLLPEALAALPAGISHTLNSPAGMEALRFEHDLLCQHGVLHPHSLHVPRETIRQMFLEERVAMCCDTPAQAGAARAQGIPLGLAPFPQHRAPGTMAIADAFVLLRGARNKEAAWQFLRFLFADDTYRDYCHHFRKNPVRKVVLEDPSFRSEEAGQAEFLRLLPQSRVFPLHEKLQPLLEEIGKAVHRVLADGVDSQEALQITI